MRSHVRIAAIAVSFLVLVAMAGAGQARPRLTGSYSSMVSSSEGDIGGVLLTVYYSKTGAGTRSPQWVFHVVMQWSEGVPDVPVLLPLDVKGSTIEFTFPPGNKYADGLQGFRGVVSEAGITGAFGNGHKVTLKRLPC